MEFLFVQGCWCWTDSTSSAALADAEKVSSGTIFVTLSRSVGREFGLPWIGCGHMVMNVVDLYWWWGRLFRMGELDLVEVVLAQDLVWVLGIRGPWLVCRLPLTWHCLCQCGMMPTPDALLRHQCKWNHIYVAGSELKSVQRRWVG